MLIHGAQLQSIIPVGPLFPASVFTKEEAGVVEKDPILEWLDKQPLSSVLYVSFGSIADLSASQLVELGLGLEASDQRFIWVVRPSSDVALDNFPENLLPGKVITPNCNLFARSSESRVDFGVHLIFSILIVYLYAVQKMHSKRI